MGHYVRLYVFSPTTTLRSLIPRKCSAPDTSGGGCVMKKMNVRRAAGRRFVHERTIKVESDESRAVIRLNHEAVIVFIEEMQKSVIELRAAAEHHDVSTLKRISHYLHGAAAFVDAPAMSQLCSALERMSNCDDLARIDDALTALEIETAWMWVELNDRAAEQSSEAA